MLLVTSLTGCFGFRSLKSYFSDMKKKVELEFFGFLNDTCSIKGTVKNFEISSYPFEDLLTVFEYEDKGYLFPQTISDGEIKAFYYKKKDSYLLRDYYRSEFYLSWKMDEPTFASEIARISSIETWCKSPKYTTNLFNLPAYIGIYNYYGEFEYAIVDETNRTLHYIYLFDVKKYNNFVFEKDFQPKRMLFDSDIDMTPEERDYLYSMYMKEYLSSI